MSKKKQSFKPNPFAYAFYTFCAKVFCFFKRVKIDRKIFNEQIKKSKKTKKGFLLIYNHHSNKDHFVITSSLNGHKTNFVLAKYFSYNKVISTVTSWVKGISKDQFKPDLATIRNMKRALDRPGIVAVAPAGQVAVDGGPQFVSKGIVKLVRFCRADVIGLQMYGNHFNYPKWQKSKRKSKMWAKFVNVVKEEDIAKLSDDELYDIIVKTVCIDSFAVQTQEMNKIKGKEKALGLESELYYCPKCGAMHQNYSEGNYLKCHNCNNVVLYNDYGFFEAVGEQSVAFKTETEWYEYQKKLIKEKLMQSGFHLEGSFDLYRNLRKPNILEKFGEGKLYLTTDRLYFEGTLQGEPYMKEFLHNSIFQLPYSPSKHIFIPDDEGPFKFKPRENFTCVNEWVQTIDALREIREKEGKSY